jgi:uncharacterized protein (DUF433 family)
MSTLTDIGTLIVSTPDTCGGRPRIAGTRMSVEAIAIYHNGGMSAEQLVAEYPHLNLAQVHAALAYYYANKEKIDADIAAYYEECERLEAEHRAGKIK